MLEVATTKSINFNSKKNSIPNWKIRKIFQKIRNTFTSNIYVYLKEVVGLDEKQHFDKMALVLWLKVFSYFVRAVLSICKRIRVEQREPKYLY